MKNHRDILDPCAAATLPPSPAKRERARTLLEQLGDLGRLPSEVGAPSGPQR